jgi:arsenite methyltransferase
LLPFSLCLCSLSVLVFSVPSVPLWLALLEVPMNAEEAVRDRYSRAARQTEAALCCPVSYDPRLLDAIPDEILQRDYGCGDPTPHLQPGETVLDLGSGGGKVCFIAAQVVGPHGRVIGVDSNRDMLALALEHLPAVSQRLGFANVTFHCGLIQDLRLDLDRLAAELQRSPVADQYGWLQMRALEERLRREAPLIPDDSVDVVVSNCVLNLVRPEDRERLFAEVFRVLHKGGRAVICDIAADENVPDAMRADPELWSGCIAGAHREDLFLQAFADAGFHGIELVKREPEPWRVVNGIEFRSLTVRAYKGKQGPCRERKQALIYRGPFKKVEDDDGHVFPRGERMAVCDKTFQLLQRPPYEGMFEPVEPYEEVLPNEAAEYDCRRPARRHPRETKGQDYDVTTEGGGSCCGEGGYC